MVPRNGGLLRPRCQRYHQTMDTLQALPQWVQMEHEVAQILQTRRNMDGTLMKLLHETHQLSSRNFEILKLLRDKHPFVRGSEFTPKRPNKTSGSLQEPRSQSSKNLTQPHVTTSHGSCRQSTAGSLRSEQTQGNR